MYDGRQIYIYSYDESSIWFVKKESKINKIWTVFILIRIIRNFDNKFAGVVKILVRYYHVFLTE